MTQHPGKTLPPLYLTAEAPCPYLPGRSEKKIFTHLLGPSAEPLNDMLSHAGFRRSQTIAYRPACDDCSACISVRIVASDLEYGRSFRRILKTNETVTGTVIPPRASQEQFSLLRHYLDARHADGGMADMTIMDYTSMVQETTVDTRLIEYRLPPEGPADLGQLIGVALTDRLCDGLSMVYSFYDTSEPARSLGTFMVLDHVERTLREGLDYVYLGYWVDGCGKMQYKVRFEPLEALGPDGWTRLHRPQS